MIDEIYKIVRDTIQNKWVTRNSAAYIEYLKRKGVKIGLNCFFFEPYSHFIDLTRPELISIGDNVKVAGQCVILTHGFDWCVLRELHPGEIFGSAGIVNIGSNVFIGKRCMILKGVEIGENCVIGAGSVVSKSVPKDSVVAGNPAKVISSIDSLYQKYINRQVKEAKTHALAIYSRLNRLPMVSDFKEFFYLFTTVEEAEKNGINVKKQTTEKYYKLFKEKQIKKFSSFMSF